MKDQSKFWNRMAARYSKAAISDMATYEKKLEITRSYFTPEMNILEIGCGTGSTALLHAAHVRHIRATDIAENMIAIAREKAMAEGIENVDFDVATAEAVAAPDGSLDMVLALNLLHLVDDKEAVIANIHRMLKPGGIFISSTACLNDGLGFMKYIVPLMRLVGLAPMVKFFTQKDYVDGIKAAGFTIEQEWKPEGRAKALFVVARKAG